ncbi:GyrI-like domain-containing protein [Bacillus alkalicellulosilyticus]|uniref:GyrI-like domain-containing protein n=1 Tax=Alkalihalobacterium alkalicellulosilyticum TaxID=1912214 RepID=UPI0009970889|nr:GyrI-like domain-containing protein [Bacillus alkalicellulosilyticus]
MVTENQQVMKDNVRNIHRDLYHVTNKSKQCQILLVPEMSMITSSDVLNGDFYGLRTIQANDWMYLCFNRIRTFVKKELHKNFTMSPFELVWGEEINDGRVVHVGMWVPDYVTDDLLQRAMLTRLGDDSYPLQIEKIPAYQCVQVLHTGPYSLIHETVQHLGKFANEYGYQIIEEQAKEIHLSHVNIGFPEQTNLLLRIPVRKKEPTQA